MRPSFRLLLILSLVAHLGIFALVGVLRKVGGPADMGVDIISVKVLLEDARLPEPAFQAPERVRQERQRWAPREASVPPSRMWASQAKPARAPASAQSPAGLEPAGGLASERAPLHPVALAPSLSPAPPAAMKHLAYAPEASVQESVGEASLPREAPDTAEAPAGAEPAGGQGGLQAPRAEPPAEKARGGEHGAASASLIIHVSPVYPRYCRIHGEEGTVVLDVEIGADGKVGRVRIVESSGYRRLDAAAVDALRAASYRPAMRGGQPVHSVKRVAIAFRLRDAEPSGESD